VTEEKLIEKRARLRREGDLRIPRLPGGLEPPTCWLQDSWQASTACWRVLSWQLTSGGSSSQCAPVGPSNAQWNDRWDTGGHTRRSEVDRAGAASLCPWRLGRPS
jgi:hypothetical protein